MLKIDRAILADLDGDHALAERLCLEIVQNREPELAEAHVMLGRIYDAGKGRPPDLERAAEHYRLAAQLGDVVGMHNYAWVLGRGEGVRQDEAAAARLYEKAAQQGYVKSMTNLALAYQYARGVRLSHGKAAEWYRRAAERGDDIAQLNLAYLHERGLGVEPSSEEAERWYRRAAGAGNAKALFNLAHRAFEAGQDEEGLSLLEQSALRGYAEAQSCLADCLAVRGEFERAYAFFLAAAAQGDREARAEVRSLRRDLTPAARARARSRLRSALDA